MDDRLQQEQLVAWMRRPENRYIEVRVLADGSVAALHDLLYTRSIILGCNWSGYASRFCFKDRELARQRFESLVSEDDIPAGFVASRGLAAERIAAAAAGVADSEGGDHD